MIELWTILLFSVPTSACLAPISQNFKEEERSRQAWNDFLDWEEDLFEKWDELFNRLGDAHVLLEEQFGKIERKEHLFPATLRVEQVHRRILELNATITEIERAYAKAPEPQSEMHKERLADKRDDLAKLTDPKNGELSKARDALVRLIDTLEKDREPGLEAAREARKRLDELARSMRQFRDRYGPGITCYMFLTLLNAVEREQRRVSAQLHQMQLDLQNDPPVELMHRRKK